MYLLNIQISNISLLTFASLLSAFILGLFIRWQFKKKSKEFTFNDLRYESASYQEVLHSLKNQQFLVNITNYINTSGNFNYKIQKTLSLLGKYTEVDRIYIFEEIFQGRFISNTYEWCKQKIKPEKEKYLQLAYTPALHNLKALLTKDGVIYSTQINESSDPVKSIFETRNIYSSLIFPIQINNNFHGFIGFESSRHEKWSDLDGDFLKTISLIISNAFERSFYEEDLKKSEKKFKDLFNYSSDSIFIIDYLGELLEVNIRACEVLQFAKETLVKQNIESLLPKGRFPRDKFFNAIENQGESQILETELITSEGKLISVELNGKPIIFNNKEAILCVARDISGRKEMQREILSAIIQAEEKERGRIARDLHDGIGPLLSSLKLYTKVLGTTSDAEKREQMLKNTMEVIDESMILTKEILNNLSPHVLNDFGLASAIHSFCKKITLTKAIDVKFDSNVFDQRFDTNVEIVLFRILKELVNNTIKHALASRIDIFLLRTEDTLSLVYSDDGIGFDFKKVLNNQSSGMGISNIVNRIRSINGRLMFENQKGKGIQIKLEVELIQLSEV